MIVKIKSFGNKKIIYNKINEFGYQVYIMDDSNEKKIPLIISEKDMYISIKRLDIINKGIDFPFDYLYNVVAGCLLLCVKYG